MYQLSERGYGIDKSTITPRVLEELKRELTVTPYASNAVVQATPPSIPVYLESSKKIYIPKWFGLQRFGVPTQYKWTPPTSINLTFNGSLRPEQEEPVQKYLQAAHDPLQTGGIINLFCGGGKTLIALYIISQLKQKTLIIVHKEFLLDQWKERINSFLPGARIGIIKAKTLDVKDKDIVIASLQSLSMKDYSEETFHGFGLLVVDEVHRTGTEVFSQALKKLNIHHTLGLSATVNRKDGMSKVFKWYIGDIVFKSKRKKDDVFVDICEFWASDRAYNKEETLGYNKVNFSKMITNICQYQPRTDVIVAKIIHYMCDPAATDKRRKILVLSERKNHLGCIQHSLNAIDKSITSGFYVGGMKPADLQESLTKDVILSTTAFVQEGFDCKDLDTLVFATPKSDIEQCVGRILRATGDERINVPIIIDVIDMFSVFEKQGAKRKQYYKRAGFCTTPGSLDHMNTLKGTPNACLFDDDG